MEYSVYFYFINDELVYIGKTNNIAKRLTQHKTKDYLDYCKVNHILFMVFDSEGDALDFERYYTRHFQPRLNISNKDCIPKSYKLPEQELFPYAKIPHNIFEEFEHNDEITYCTKVLIPNFQKKIHNISL